jgi:hypothetical protein
MEELAITVDENNYEVGIRKILKAIRPNWREDNKLKVSTHISQFIFVEIGEQRIMQRERKFLIDVGTYCDYLFNRLVKDKRQAMYALEHLR